jgi:tetratricopeptide (TPR) repeat protein
MPARTIDGTRTAGLAAIVLAVIAVLWTADVMLARAERAERRDEAHGDWSSGMRLLAAGRAAEAEDWLRKAYAIDRTNASYGLDLATALTAGGKFDDATELLEDLLKSSPNDGATNLAAARLSVHRGNIEDAEAYYHRAIYGSWPKDARTHRVETRLELAGLLDSTGGATELLAELLPLEPEVQGNLAEEKRVATLYLDAHSPARAAAAYRGLIAADPNDSDVYSGLGQAELALADYGAAEDAFRAALRRQPESSQIQARLEARLDLAANMAGLDPTLRRLTSREKYQRSVRVLQAARDSLTRCAPPEKIAGEIDLDEADRILKKREPSYVTNEAAEELLGLAERIWRARVRDCGVAVSPEEEPVDRIISALSQ